MFACKTFIGLLQQTWLFTLSLCVSQTTDKIQTEYLRRLALPQYQNLSEVILAEYAFDAVWALALALDKTSEMIASKNDTGCEHAKGELLALEDFAYTNEKMGCLLIQAFSEVSFTGASVSHDDH